MNPNTDVDELPPDTVRESTLSLVYRINCIIGKEKIDLEYCHIGLQFNKDSGNTIEELKLRVAYISPNSPQGSSEDDASKNSTQKLDTSSVSLFFSHPLLNQFESPFYTSISKLVILCI